MTPLYGIACFYDVCFGARAVSRKTPIYFIQKIKIMRKSFLWNQITSELKKLAKEDKSFWTISPLTREHTITSVQGTARIPEF